MGREELDKKLLELEESYNLERKKIIKQYCIDNNTYRVGDKFTDHIGSILIDEIKYNLSLHPIYGPPCCVYYGIELKKDGTPKKSGERRGAYQVNDISIRE